jgi:hypothetical protein
VNVGGHPIKSVSHGLWKEKRWGGVLSFIKEHQSANPSLKNLLTFCMKDSDLAHVITCSATYVNALLRWSRLWWCMSPQKLFFCYHLPTRGRAGVKLGDVDML